MARERYAPGVYIIVATGGASGDLIVDNRKVPFQVNGETATLYVKDFMSFDEGKMEARFISENLDGISGRGVL